MTVVRWSDGHTGHGLESLLAGWQSRGPGPEVDQVLLVERTHLLNDGPQPPLEGDQPLAGLSRLVIEGSVTDQSRHVDVSDSV